MSYDRQRVQKVSDRTTLTEIMYSVCFVPFFSLNGQPWETVVCLEDYKGRYNQMLVVTYVDVKLLKGYGERK